MSEPQEENMPTIEGWEKLRNAQLHLWDGKRDIRKVDTDDLYACDILVAAMEGRLI